MRFEHVAAVLAVVDWIVAAILTAAALHHGDSLALRERAITAIALAVVATVFALLQLNKGAGSVFPIAIHDDLAELGVIVTSVPGIVFLLLFLRNDFGRREP